jgi:transcriptional regulator with XRE-family HTH domain
VPKRKARKKMRPLKVNAPEETDERLPDGLRDLPQRVAEANRAGPRYNGIELARQSGLSQSVISRLANSSNLFGIRLDTIYRLAEALNVSVSSLLGESRTSTRQAPSRRKRAGKAGRKKLRAR